MNHPEHRSEGSIDGRLERAKDVSLGKHHPHPTVGDEIGEAAGGIAGALLGAGLGATAGPVGALVGGIAGAIGGWWTGRAIAEAASNLSVEDDAAYRAHYESSPMDLAHRHYEDVRAAYYLGHIASHNPNFTDREFDEVEPELERGWAGCPHPPCTWEHARVFVREGYRRGAEARGRHASRTQDERTIKSDETDNS